MRLASRSSLLALVFLVACEGGGGPTSQGEPAPLVSPELGEPGAPEFARTPRYRVEPYQVPCVGEGTFLCLVATDLGTGRTHRVFEGIRGFDFEWGVTQEIEVLEQPVPNPPADASSVERILQQRFSATRGAPGSRFFMPFHEGILTHSPSFLERLPDGFRLEATEHLSCASSEACRALEARLGSAEAFWLELAYPVSPGASLVLHDVRLTAP
ncbi:DUF4377 domain-containing protein [Pyxidicoccus sp. 3LG]